MAETTGKQANQAVRVEKNGPVAILTLDRPEGRNSFDVQTDEKILEAVRGLDRDPETKSVIITGTGKWFCTGADVAEMRENLDRLDAHFDDLTLPYHAMISTIHHSDTVFIAAVNGVAAGGGVGLALACDLVFAQEDARFVFAYSNLGVSPDGGATAHLVRAAGPHRAREALLMDEGLSPSTLAQWGLVNRVVPADRLLEEANATAATLATRSRVTVRATKHLVEAATHTSFNDSLERERRSIIQSAATPDAHEGITAFFEKRKPRFP
jgi:2-(1,2-epoxy-1,2-dihydrophenyl)acetyl-CoA isomerase